MKMLLAGEWVDRTETIDVRDPFDNSLIDTVPSASHDDVETALAAAFAARETARKMTTYERCQILGKTAAIIADQIEDFATIIAREGSKTINEARGEARRTVNTLTISAERPSASSEKPSHSTPSPVVRSGAATSNAYRSASSSRLRPSTTPSTWSPTSSGRRSQAATP